MTSNETSWGLASLVLTTIQYIPYFRGIFTGRVKPHVFSWLVWALPAGITFFAQIAKGAGAGAWATGYTTLLCIAVFILSLSRGEKKIVLLDWVTLFCALLAIAVWAMTDDPLGAVILATIANGLGFIPTVRKSIEKPYEESIISYCFSTTKWFCSIIAAQSMTVTTLLFPIASVIMALAFTGFVLMRRDQLKRLVPSGMPQ